MSKPRIKEDQYISELNLRLRQHELYRDGMAFIPYPAGATGREMSGYSVTGPFELTGVYAQIANKVGEEFDLDV